MIVEYESLKLANLELFDDYRKSFESTLNSGWYILGNEVRSFEKAFAEYCQSSHCVGVASGLDALILSLKALNLSPGDEVIVPSNTYIATILAILNNGLRPVLVEPDIKTYNIDPKKIIEKINKKTKAIIIVHLYGKACQMDEIKAISKNHNLFLIEDCAQAHGAKFKDQVIGSFGDFGAFSFYPTKNLGAMGDAGAIVTNNPEFAEKISMLRNYGSKIKYYNEEVGMNSRLDEFQAGFLSAKLKILNKINTHKRDLAELYFNNLSQDYILPERHENFFDVFHIFNIRCRNRDLLKEFLLKNNIKTEIHYPVPPHKQKAMQGFLEQQSYPISEEIHQTTLSLPISYGHKKEEINYVIEKMNEFSKNYATK